MTVSYRRVFFFIARSQKIQTEVVKCTYCVIYYILKITSIQSDHASKQGCHYVTRQYFYLKTVAFNAVSPELFKTSKNSKKYEELAKLGPENQRVSI